MVLLKEGQVYPVPPFASSTTRLLSIDPGCFCVILFSWDFFPVSLWYLVVEVGVVGGGWGE